ncbi:hypothetical protein K443DRAFT_624845 [Laccaria amethystina LaAM-08-1]|uniref:Uncharacterized protein n=1 Tax=Laccaria amethystina LaAM-08-1 TaxID=1095629 RepID=A0A0C9WNI3_9AGAR|nr:hypothetical protein K443DRAFT_624845 [Laccaria amethystina LaAM-08-1]
MAQVLRGFVFYCVLLLIWPIYFALLPGRRIVPYSTGILNVYLSLSLVFLKKLRHRSSS